MNFQKNVALILLVAALVAAGYYAFSPYQNCLRTVEDGETNTQNYCFNQTSW